MIRALFGSPTLAFYLGKRFARAMLIVFMTVFALIYMLDFVELLRRTSDVPNATSLALARLSLMRTPAIAEQVFPFAVLFGAMLTLLDLSRKLELVIARAAGLSAWQFLLAPLVVAILFGGLLIGIYNPISARLKEKAVSVEAQLLGKAVPTSWMISGFDKKRGWTSGYPCRLTRYIKCPHCPCDIYYL